MQDYQIKFLNYETQTGLNETKIGGLEKESTRNPRGKRCDY